MTLTALLSVLQADVAPVLHPDCLADMAPFALDTAFFACAIAIALVAAALLTRLHCAERRARPRHDPTPSESPRVSGGFMVSNEDRAAEKRRRKQKVLARVAQGFTSAVLLSYIRTTSLALKTLHCITDSTSDQRVLASNPYVTCWEGAHAVAAALAVAALAIMHVFSLLAPTDVDRARR